MPRIETLFLREDDKPELSFAQVAYRSIHMSKDEGFAVEISTPAFFTATRYLSLDDLAAIRDWCNEVIAADAEVPAVAAE